MTAEKPFTVFIEGNIAAGKSTLLKFLSQSRQIQCYPEPINRWENLSGHNLLQLYYNDPENFAFPFQSFALLTMMKNYASTTGGEKIKVMERSTVLNMFLPE